MKYFDNIVDRSKCQVAKMEEMKTRLYSDDESVLTSTEHDSVCENVKTAMDQLIVGRHYSGTFCIRTTQAFLRLQGLVCNNQ